MCQIMIDRVDTDPLQQAIRITALVSGRCEFGGELYMRVLWNNGQIGPESAFKQVSREFHHLPITYTAHDHTHRLKGVRVVVKCKATSVSEEREI